MIMAAMGYSRFLLSDFFCGLLNNLRRRIMINNIQDDFDTFCTLFSYNFIFPTLERIIFENDVGLGYSISKTKIFDAIHNERKGDWLEAINHHNSSRIIDDRTTFALQFSYEFVGINADD